MNGEMKVAVMEGIGKIGYTKRPIPTPKSNEVLVKLEYVGICGSDMHYYETGAIGDYVVKPPFVLGHERGGRGWSGCDTPEGGRPCRTGARKDLRALRILQDWTV